MKNKLQNTVQDSRDPFSFEIQNSDSFITTFTVPKMDCASEEQLIRMQFDDINPGVALEFDIPNHIVQVFHTSNPSEIEHRMKNCELGAILNQSEVVEKQIWINKISAKDLENEHEAKILKLLLAINALMFLAEFTIGWIAQSTGLIADSLDMFADAAVYGIALFAVGSSAVKKLRAAHLSGWIQLLLACGVLSEVLRRYLFGSEPDSLLMIGMGFVALIANSLALMLIFKRKESGAHMKASWIFSANDVIANFGVILAGVLVTMTGSSYPDLVIGLIIAIIVLNGAIRILRIRH